MKSIAKDVFQIALAPRNSINAYLAEGYLIDAGIRSSFKKIKKQIANHSVKGHAITHAHADHQGASKQICQYFDIPFLCSKTDQKRAEKGTVTEEYPRPKHWVSKLQMKFWAGPGHQVDQTLQEGNHLGQFEVISTPGHASGHISLFRPKDGLLIAGDLLTNMNLLTTRVGLHEPPNIFTKNKKENFNSILKIAELKPKIICFGHGPVLYDEQKFTTFIEKTKRKYLL